MEKEYRHNNKVAIYRSADGETQLSVEIDKDTVWSNGRIVWKGFKNHP